MFPNINIKSIHKGYRNFLLEIQMQLQNINSPIVHHNMFRRTSSRVILVEKTAINSRLIGFSHWRSWHWMNTSFSTHHESLTKQKKTNILLDYPFYHRLKRSIMIRLIHLICCNIARIFIWIKKKCNYKTFLVLFCFFQQTKLTLES